MSSPPNTANITKLVVKSQEAAILSFPVDGILGEMDAQLGKPVGAFDPVTSATFYSSLGSIAPKPNDKSLLLFNSESIYVAVGPYRLAALRLDDAQAALDGAILARQTAFYTKYVAASGIETELQKGYENKTGYKWQLLQQLATLSSNQEEALAGAYAAAMPGSATPGVVTPSGVVTATTTASSGGVGGDTTSAAVAATGATSPPMITTSTYVSNVIASNGSVTPIWEGGADGLLTTSSQSVPVSTQTSFNQSTSGSTISTGYTYRCPTIENQAQYARAAISLIDESYALYTFAVQVPYLATIFTNELALLDSGVKRLQVAYLNRMLMSPIPGTVTGIFKNLGERVRAGEPVLRVENIGPQIPILLEGTLAYDGPLPISTHGVGSTFNLRSAYLGSPLELSGHIIVVRGHKADENHWDVVMVCGSNPQNIPPNYYFGVDDTTVAIS